jgi:hypothetical protein
LAGGKRRKVRLRGLCGGLLGKEFLDGIGEGLVGALEQEGDLPHLDGAQEVLIGGHAGEADAVLDLPEGFAGRVVRDADDVAVGVLLPELRGGRIHPLGKLGVLSGNAMASGAVGDVQLGSGLEDILTDTERRSPELAVDAGF